jgi:hypothetical protein
MGYARNTCRILVGKPKANRQRGKPRHTHDNNIKICHKAIRCEDMDGVQLPKQGDQWQALVNTVMKPRFPYRVGFQGLYSMRLVH